VAAEDEHLEVDRQLGGSVQGPSPEVAEYHASKARIEHTDTLVRRYFAALFVFSVALLLVLVIVGGIILARLNADVTEIKTRQLQYHQQTASSTARVNCEVQAFDKLILEIGLGVKTHTQPKVQKIATC
jgi:hypothetical protein